MVRYDFKGIKIEAKVLVDRQDYRDGGGHYKSRIDKNSKVVVRFWGFNIAGCLTELAFVKSTLNYFMQCYWKRTSKEGSRIELYKAIHHCHDSHFIYPLLLMFTARQKNRTHYLEICFLINGNPEGRAFLDGQEVLMLDIAIGKAISLMAPKVLEIEEESEEKKASETSEPKKSAPIQYLISFDC